MSFVFFVSFVSVIVVKVFLKLPKLLMIIKQKTLSLFRNFALATYGQSLIVFLAKVNMLFILYLIISLPALPSITYVKLSNVSLAPNIVKMVITDLAFLKYLFLMV